MKVYIASKLENASKVHLIQQLLREKGYTFPHDWASLYLGGNDKADDLADQQIAAVTNSDAVVLLLPGGRGSHVEFGAALGAGRPTAVLRLSGDDTKVIGFYRACNTPVLTNLSELAEFLLEVKLRTL